MIVYECDRCGTTDELFMRHLEVNGIGVDMSTISDPAHAEYDLCGYCWSKVKQVIDTPDGTP